MAFKDPLFRPHVALVVLGALVFSLLNVRLADASERKVTVREGDGDYVVLLHGFSVFNSSLHNLAKRLNRAGFETIDIEYPSKKTAPESVVDEHLRPAVEEYCTDPKRKIHFVGYSMGTIFIHRFLDESTPKNLGRVVFLAGPHRGVRLIDIAKEKFPGLAKPFGVAADKLGTGTEDFPQSLSPVSFSPGVIMGKRSAFPFFSPMIPGPDDGIVPVDGGKFEGAADFLVIDSSHTDMQNSKVATFQVHRFITTGAFDHETRFRVENPRPNVLNRKRRHF